MAEQPNTTFFAAHRGGLLLDLENPNAVVSTQGSFNAPVAAQVEDNLVEAASRADEGSVTQTAAASAGMLGERTSIQYILEIYRDGERLASIPLPYQPSQKSVGKRAPKVLRYTLGEFPIREHSPTRAWRQTYSGMVGIRMRPYQGWRGTQKSMRGLQTLIEFDKFLDWYQVIAEAEGASYLASPGNKSNKSFQERTYLVFHDLDEGLSHRVEVDDFTWDRDSSSTRVGNANWRLSLHGYQLDRMPTKGPAGMGDSRAKKNLKQVFSATAWDKVEQLKQIKLIDHLSKSLSVSEEIRGQLRDLKSPLTEFQKAVASVKAAIGTASDVLRIPFTLYSDVVRCGESVLGIFTQIRNLGVELTSSFDQSTTRLFNIYATVEATVTHSRTAFAFMRAPQELLARGPTSYRDTLSAWKIPVGSGNIGIQASPITGSANVPVKPYVVQAGDTWPSIAAAVLGDPDAWAFLAAFNGASDAYSVAGGAPLAAGTTVLIPAPALGNGLTSAASAADLYGTDLLLDFATGDLVLADETYLMQDNSGFSFETADDRADVAYVSGEANFMQALTNRMLTPRGQVPFLKNYGVFPMSPGDPLTPTVLASSVSTMRDQFLRDPRVRSLRRMEVLEDGDAVDVSVSVQGITGGPVTVVAPLLG